MARKLYLQCTTGISGDMFLAAMADLGLDLSPLQAKLQSVHPRVRLKVSSTRRQGLQGSQLEVSWDPEEQPLRHLSDLLALVERLDLTPAVRERSRAAFERLARVEAAVHGIGLEEVHFHEVGAVDTLVDVAGAFWALEQLGIEEVHSSHLPWFEGTVECAHGRLPLPAPATLELLKDKPVYSTGFCREIITPTGALLLDQMAARFSAGFSGKIRQCGLGFGAMDLGETPNALRALLFEETAEAEKVWVLESNLDHLSGEEIGGAFEELFRAGALDVLYLPGVMKKNRPGGMLQAVCTQESVERVEKAFFKQTLTLGIRRTEMERRVLPRRPSRLETAWGEVEAKSFSPDGQEIQRPEYEALKELADRTGRSVAELRYLMGRGGASS
jgi:hypothetical protein